MQIIINNCNNIDSGSVEIKENTLNIKHAINGTGKSTVARSILAAVLDKTSGKELAKFLPYKLAGQTKLKSVVVGCESLKNVAVFDEKYISDLLFQPDELVKGSFEIFVRGDEYDQGMAAIDGLFQQLKSTLNSDTEINELLSDFDQIISAFGSDVKGGGMHGKSAISTAFKEGNPVANIPLGLEPYKKFIQHEKNYAWVGWQQNGAEFLEIAEDCPFCAGETQSKVETIKRVSEVYKPKTIENLNKIVTTFKKLEKYFSEDTKNRINVFVTKISGYTDDESAYLVEVKEQIKRLKGRLVEARNLGFVSLKDVDKMVEALDSKIIDLSLYPYLTSPDTTSKIAIVNGEINKLRLIAGELQGTIKKQKKVIQNLVQEHGKYIDDFLKNAGYNYHILLTPNESDEYRLKLEPNGVEGAVSEVKTRLSFGERNAFALVLFMFHALKIKADLIILDDPISSFDKNKKYAIMERLFSNGGNSFRGKTVLMLTHDFEPIVDLVHHHRDRFGSLSAWFLENKNGVLTEKSISKHDIQTFVSINFANIADEIHMLHKVVYLRRYFEVTNNKSIVFDVLSSVVHRRDVPHSFVDALALDGSPIRELKPMTTEDIQAAICEIRKHIGDFDYKGLYDFVVADKKMIDLYEATTSNYEKLHIYRILFDGRKDKLESTVITKFINQAFHIENDYIYQLNPRHFQMVPQYVIDECDKGIERLNM